MLNATKPLSYDPIFDAAEMICFARLGIELTTLARTMSHTEVECSTTIPNPSIMI